MNPKPTLSLSTLLQRVKATYKMSSSEIEITATVEVEAPEVESPAPQEPNPSVPAVQLIEAAKEGEKEPQVEQEEGEEADDSESEYSDEDFYTNQDHYDECYDDGGWGCDWNESGYFD